MTREDAIQSGQELLAQSHLIGDTPANVIQALIYWLQQDPDCGPVEAWREEEPLTDLNPALENFKADLLTEQAPLSGEEFNAELVRLNAERVADLDRAASAEGVIEALRPVLPSMLTIAAGAVTHGHTSINIKTSTRAERASLEWSVERGQLECTVPFNARVSGSVQAVRDALAGYINDEFELVTSRYTGSVIVYFSGKPHN